jgi:thioredoxin-related protein
MDKLIKFVVFLVVAGAVLKVLGMGPFAASADGAGLEGLQTAARAEGKDKIVVLLTGTSWCTYCKDLDKAVISTSEWQDFASSEIVFAAYEYGAFNRPKSGVKGEMLQHFDIEGFPTMIVLNSRGKVLDEQAGYGGDSVSEMKEWIRSL